MEIARLDGGLTEPIVAPDWSDFARRQLWAFLKLALIAAACWLAAVRISAATPPDSSATGSQATDLIAEAMTSDEVVARIASMQPQLPSGAAPTPPTTRPGAGGASPLALGASLRRLGGPRGPQASAPPVIGDRFGGGQSCITIPVMVGPGAGVLRTIQAGPRSVPFVIPIEETPGFGTTQLLMPAQQPLQITSANQPPAFPSRTFLTVGDYNQANQAFQAGNPIALQDNPQFNQDAQNALNASFPAGTVLPNGQIAAGGGTAQPQSTAAILDQAASGPPDGRFLSEEDLFFIRGNFLYIPNVVLGPNQPTVFCVNPASAGAAVVGTVKLAENTSPLPRDRVFLNYSSFDGTTLPGGPTVNRFTPGFEKTFLDQLMSVEMRFPFAATISPDLLFDNGAVNTVDDVVFGNLSAVFKGLLYQNDVWAYSAGLQVAVPTAPELSITLLDGSRILLIENESVHLMPFLGALYTPNERLFMQAFLQLDVDANGNPVAINPGMQGLREIGRINDVTFLYADLNLGYWLYRSEETWLTGFAPSIELHYNTSLEQSEVLASQGFLIGSVRKQVSNLNLTAGCYFEIGLDSTFVLGYTAPLGNGSDQQFDGELRAFFTHRFGPNTRATRISAL
jgi:hypothetical protein